MKKILYIVYYFPPYQITDSFRATRVAKFLPDNGIKPIVLTGYEGKHHWQEKTLDELPPEVEIHRVSNPISYKRKNSVNLYKETSKLQKFKNRLIMTLKDIVISPDSYIIWTLKIIPTAIKLIKKHKIDHVMICIGPYSPALAGYILKKLTGVTYTLDYRDEWRKNYKGTSELFERQVKPESLPRRFWNNFWEKRCVENAKNVFTVSKHMTDVIKKFYPKQKRAFACYNGFVKSEYSHLDSSPKPTTDILQFYYIGHFDVDSLSYNPIKFLSGYKSFLKNSEYKAQLHLFGDMNEQTKALITKLALDNDIVIHGRFEHSTLLKKLMKADFFVQFCYPDLHPETLSLKMFEYVFLNKPIISFSSEVGEMASFIKETRSGYTCWGYDENSIEKLFHKIIEFPKEELFSPERKEIIEKYNFEKIVSFMASKLK